MPITTVVACKALRDIDTGNQEHDAELSRIIQSLQEYLEGQCGVAFDAADITEYFDGDECTRGNVLVTRTPINSVANLWDDPTRAFTTPLSVASYDIKNAKAGIVRLLDGRMFQPGQRSIKMTYNGGYTSILPFAERIASEQVWAAREKGQHNLIGVRSRSIADGSVQFVNLDWSTASLAAIIQHYSIRVGVG